MNSQTLPKNNPASGSIKVQKKKKTTTLSGNQETNRLLIGDEVVVAGKFRFQQRERTSRVCYMLGTRGEREIEGESV